jgi:hypothetical protein
MHDHPVLGVVLFAFGVALTSFAYFGSLDGNHISSIVVGNILAINGILFATLGSRKFLLARARSTQ